MDSSKFRNRFINGILRAGESFLRYLLIAIMLFATIRVYSFYLLSKKLSLPVNKLALFSVGYFYDILFLLQLSILIFIPFWLVHIIVRRLAISLWALVIFLLVIGELVLVNYMGTTSLLLGVDLFGYNLDEIKHIISASGAISISSILPFIVFTLLLLCLFYFSLRVSFKRWLIVTFFIVTIGAGFFSKQSYPNNRDYKSEMEFNLVVNKTAYFSLAAYNNFIAESNPNESQLFPFFYTGNYVTTNSFKLIDPEYPFLHYDETVDFLGKYFNKGERNPNVVFILVESLARAYSGENAYLTSFTPFLDSLSKKSLYFENMLSTSGRTFEVFPSVLGSLPYGESGFCEMGEQMPNSLSIISLLKKNGYKSNFFYGGDSDFDNMRLFMEKQGIDRIIDEKSFEKTYKKMPPTPGGYTWGYGDRDLFIKSLNSTPTSDQPRIDIYMTLSMHDPYFINQQDYYNYLFEEKILNISKSEKTLDEFRKFKLNYASILYFDDALRNFFIEYRKRPDYKNTIFIITGDHRMSTPPIATQIDRFHVPLVIYSPMLKKAEKFSSVSTHLDIAPSIVAFLRNSYNLSFPKIVPWMGIGLDSCKTFRSIHSYPFIRTKNQIIDYIDGNYFLSDNQLYKIFNDLDIERVDDDKKMREIIAKFEKFKADNIYVCKNNRIIPDSMVIRGK